MKNTKRTLFAAVTVGLVGAAGAAAASDFSGHLDFSGALFTLTDLDLGDGITPSLTWTAQSSGVSILGAGMQQAPNWTDSLLVTGPSSTVSATAQVVQTDGNAPAAGFLEINGSRYGDFELSRQTRVEFHLPASVTAGMPPGANVNVSASVYVSGPGSTFDGSDLGATNGQNLMQTLQASLSNATNDTASFHFSSYFVVNAFAAPVPEPETYALMAAGVVLVGAWSRRSARRLEVSNH